MNWIEAQKFADSHRCAECGNWPSICPAPNREWAVRCQNPEHQGFVKVKGYTEAWRSGDTIPLYIANNLERKEKRK